MQGKKQCAVIVYGDLGRSPRMQNHVFEILHNTDYSVNFLGYIENPIRKDISSNRDLKVIDLTSKFVKQLRKLPKIFYLLYALLRIIVETMQLLYILLFKLPRQQFILVQNPPSIPVLMVALIIKIIRGSNFIIDMHNYGYTILGLQINNKKIIHLAMLYERLIARQADVTFCVSKQMKIDLQVNWGIRSKRNGVILPQVLYDKANTEVFKPFLNNEDRHNFLVKMNLSWKGEKYDNDHTLFTEIQKDKAQLREDRPIFIISSTSWTKDEDFSLFLVALEAYEEYARLNQNQNLPRIFVAITGKGPEKEKFQQIFKEREPEWQFIRVVQLWLQPDDYPNILNSRLLAVADIGVCLHYSSSGVDLPMKVVDMFGAGIPVLAKKYKAIEELVDNYKNGIIFDSSIDLFEALIMIFKNFPTDNRTINEMRENVKQFREDTFHNEWMEKALPLLVASRK